MHGTLSDATAALLRALAPALGPCRGVTVEEVRSRSWASVTFSGARHDLALRIDGEGSEAAAERFLRGLDAAEFPLDGHVLADISLVSQERRPGCVRLRIEALTVRDD